MSFIAEDTQCSREPSSLKVHSARGGPLLWKTPAAWISAEPLPVPGACFDPVVSESPEELTPSCDRQRACGRHRPGPPGGCGFAFGRSLTGPMTLGRSFKLLTLGCLGSKTRETDEDGVWSWWGQAGPLRAGGARGLFMGGTWGTGTGPKDEQRDGPQDVAVDSPVVYK